MTHDLLIYLESRAVLHQGLINKNDLTAADKKQIELWIKQNLIECTPLKPPGNVDKPMFTHKIRLSETLYMKAWQTRLDKAEQFTPRIRHQADGDSKPPEFNLPKVSMYLLTESEANHTPPSKGAEKQSFSGDDPHDSRLTTHDSPTLWQDFQDWLQTKGANLMPEQKSIAKKIFTIYQHPRHRAFINMGGTGHSWLLRSIDQFFTYRSSEKSPPSKGD